MCSEYLYEHVLVLEHKGLTPEFTEVSIEQLPHLTNSHGAVPHVQHGICGEFNRVNVYLSTHFSLQVGSSHRKLLYYIQS